MQNSRDEISHYVSAVLAQAGVRYAHGTPEKPDFGILGEGTNGVVVSYVCKMGFSVALKMVGVPWSWKSVNYDFHEGMHEEEAAATKRAGDNGYGPLLYADFVASDVRMWRRPRALRNRNTDPRLNRSDSEPRKKRARVLPPKPINIGCLVMEKFDRDLWTFLNKSPRRLQKLGLPMMEAKLFECVQRMTHQEGRCVLDFKPSNVVIRSEGGETQVRIIDFDDSWIVTLPPEHWRVCEWMMVVMMFIVTRGRMFGRIARELTRRLSGEELALARANKDFLFLSAWYLFKPRGKDTRKVRYAENFLERLCERLKGPGTPAEILRGLSDLDSERFNIMEIRSINGDSFRVTTVKKKKKRRNDSREENDEENENNENDEKKKRKRKKPGSRALAITPRTLMSAECITDILPFSDDDDS